MNTRSSQNAKLVAQVLAFITICFAFSYLVIKDYSGPLAGAGDLGIWEYIGFYLAKNIHSSPLPQLNLVNNQVFYPYGTNSVFQGWGVEKDLFYATLYHFYPNGPWLQVYYFLSVIVTAILSFIILKQDYSFPRSIGAALIVSFFNFYAIHNYPGHFDTAVVHWTTVSLIVDFIIVKRVVFQQQVPLHLILARICLLLLSLGQGLGYIAGYSLMSFVVSIFFILALLARRYFKRQVVKPRVAIFLRKAVAKYKNDFSTHPRICLALLGLFIFTAYFYLPLVLQITKEAKKFDFSNLPESISAYWVNPLRLAIPFFPNFNPVNKTLDRIFWDLPEALGASSPGWFLLILGTVGLWQGRRHIAIFLPLLLIFLLCIFYHPVFLPTLKIFPWFAFNRVPGRSTVIYSTILCLFALDINFNQLSLIKKRLVSLLLVCLACTELYTAYSLPLNEQPYLLDKSFFNYMNYVKTQPGEAVLDWPFCAAGGNGVGTEKLCPYFHLNAQTWAFRKFHEKKVMGQYFGRLHPSQIEPYLQAGWDKLFFPDSPDPLLATHQTRCFRPEEWSFFTDFLKLNDFAGLNLYLDLLPENCVAEFYQRFGKPIIATVVPGAGKVGFIPKPLELRNQVNSGLGKSIKFEPILDSSESDLIRVRSPYGLTVAGLGNIESNGQADIWRPSQGRETVLSFRLAKPQNLDLIFSFTNLIPAQNVTLEVNGVNSALLNIRLGELVERRVKFQGVTGLNRISFNYQKFTSISDLLNDIVTLKGIKSLNKNDLRLKAKAWKYKRTVEFKELKILRG